MSRGPNRWQSAVVGLLRQQGGPLTMDEILARLDIAHQSKRPRTTLAARVAELVQEGVVRRTGRATYELIPEQVA